VNGHVTNGDSVSLNGAVNGDSDSSTSERNGDSESAVDGNNKSTTATVQPTTSRRDLVLITGRKENCEAAKEAILVPNITIYLTFIYDSIRSTCLSHTI